MIFFPICTLIDLGIKEILIITKEKDAPQFQNLWEMDQILEYRFHEIQNKPSGCNL